MSIQGKEKTAFIMLFPVFDVFLELGRKIGPYFWNSVFGFIVSIVQMKGMENEWHDQYFGSKIHTVGKIIYLDPNWMPMKI